jgi:hypothetical protein
MARQSWAQLLYWLVLGPVLLLLLVNPFLPLFGASHGGSPLGAVVRYGLALWLVLFALPYVLQLHRYWFDLSYTNLVLALDVASFLALVFALLGLGYVASGALSPRASVFLAMVPAVLLPLRNHLLHFHRAHDPHAPAIVLATLLILGFANALSSGVVYPLLVLLYLPLPHHWQVQAAA